MFGQQHRDGTALEVFLAFLKLGVTSFGGPIAHLGYFREELVVRRNWISESRYAELVALCQVLPGPTSSQVGFALGLQRAGYCGALAAWTAFTLPSAMMLVLFAWGAVALDTPVGAGLLLGLKSVAVAVVAHAVLGMARTLTPDLRRIGIAVVAALLVFIVPGTWGQLAAIAVGVIAGTILCRGLFTPQATGSSIGVSRRAGTVALSVGALLLAGFAIGAATTQLLWVQVADAFARAGALVFGGGHVLLPMLLGDPTIAAHVAPEQLLAGYGAAQAVPGLLFTFAAFVGFELAPGPEGLVMAFVALIAVFLPGMLLVIAALPLWKWLQAKPRAGAALLGANAAVVGILAAALTTPIITSTITGLAPLLVALGGFLLLQFVRVPAWGVVLAGATSGVVLALLGLTP